MSTHKYRLGDQELTLEEYLRARGVSRRLRTDVQMLAEEGQSAVKAVMEKFRVSPPETIAGRRLLQLRDYLSLTALIPDGAIRPFIGPQGDMLILDFEGGSFVAVHPFYSESKILFYVTVREIPTTLNTVDAMQACTDVKEFQDDLLMKMNEDIKAFFHVSKPRPTENDEADEFQRNNRKDNITSF